MEPRLVAYSTVNIPEGADSFYVYVRWIFAQFNVLHAIAQNINKYPPGIRSSIIKDQLWEW